MDFKIDKILFFDIESVSQYKELSDLPKNERKLWDKYKTNFEKRVTDTSKLPNNDGRGENSEEYWSEVYRQTAAFFPEFGKVCCISMGFVTKTGNERFESFYGEDEDEILKEFRKVLNKIEPMGFQLCGHSIKNFDIPFLAKRYFIKDLKLPRLFPSYDTKPWEMKLIDTKDIWSMGNQWSLSSLDLVCGSLGVDSPKNGDTKGDTVTTDFWGGKHEEIKDYCEKDVKALIDIINKLNDLK